MTSLEFFGGINEIGGNKFLLEDRGTRVFLDFGMQMGKANEYFAEFTQPRGLNGMGDLLELNLLPDLGGLYRKDYAKHTGYECESKVDYQRDTEYHGVLLTHAHVDHCAYIHYLRPEIPIYCTEESKLIMQTFQDTGGKEEYINYKENFQIYENKQGKMSRAKSEKERQQYARNIKLIEPYKKFSIDSIEVEPVPVDHSLPGVCGFIIHTSKGSIGYTADMRFHGRRKAESQKFVQRCAESDLDHILCEGTRVEKSTSMTEYEIEDDIKDIVNSTKQLVVVTYPVRDLDRLQSFYLAAKATDRILAIDLKQAYLLNLLAKSERKFDYPEPDDPNIRIFVPKKSWGLIGRDYGTWPPRLACGDYKGWERPLIGMGDCDEWNGDMNENCIINTDVSTKPNQYMLYCSDFSLQQLIDIKLHAGSSYIRSSTEPFDDEMRLDQERIKRWLVHFELLQKDADWNVTHVSGHGSRDQIKMVAKETKAKTLIPIHTKSPEYFHRWHKNVNQVEPGQKISL